MRVSLNKPESLMRLSRQQVEHFLRMPVPAFHARLDPLTVAVGVRHRLRPKSVAALIAAAKSRSHIGIASADLWGRRALSGSLQARGAEWVSPCVAAKLTRPASQMGILSRNTGRPSAGRRHGGQRHSVSAREDCGRNKGICHCLDTGRGSTLKSIDYANTAPGLISQ
jgi:hypothetical protein